MVTTKSYIIHRQGTLSCTEDIVLRGWCPRGCTVCSHVSRFSEDGIAASHFRNPTRAWSGSSEVFLVFSELCQCLVEHGPSGPQEQKLRLFSPFVFCLDGCAAMPFRVNSVHN